MIDPIITPIIEKAISRLADAITLFKGFSHISGRRSNNTVEERINSISDHLNEVKNYLEELSDLGKHAESLINLSDNVFLILQGTNPIVRSLSNCDSSNTFWHMIRFQFDNLDNYRRRVEFDITNISSDRTDISDLKDCCDEMVDCFKKAKNQLDDKLDNKNMANFDNMLQMIFSHCVLMVYICIRNLRCLTNNLNPGGVNGFKNS